jgi:GntR family transcriptional repressor for pyruvate dehydrogenase complex
MIFTYRSADALRSPEQTKGGIGVVEWSRLAPMTLSVPAELAGDIERLILGGELPPGSKLPPERELAQVLRVSRASVRDALRDLEMRGLVERTPGRGTIVTDRPSSGLGRVLLREPGSRERDLIEVIELRAIMEPPMTARAALRATDRDLANLQELLDAMSSGVTADRYSQLDLIFHHAIAQATHNRLLASMLEAVMPLTGASPSQVVQTGQRRQVSVEGHRRILVALRGRDPDAAESAAAEHVALAQRQLLGASERSPRGRRGRRARWPG